jgi:prolipoprotein diacylglyceryltransferase
MLPILNIGPLALQTPGLVLLFGTWLGLFIAERKAGVYHVNGGMLYDLAFIGLVAGVIGARLAFVLHFPSAFRSNPASLFSLNLNLFEPLWGIGAGIIASGLYGWRMRMSLRPSLDALTTALAVFMPFFHLAQLASGDAYGSAANLPWAIELWGARRHPLQIYETLVAILIFWLVWPRPNRFQVPGQRFLAFVAGSAGARLFLEAFRGDSPTWNGIRSAQIFAWLILAACLWVLSIFPVKQTGNLDDQSQNATF